MAQPLNQSINQLTWLIGNWQGTYDESPSTESWGPIHNNQLLGTFQSADSNQNPYTEVLRIHQELDSLKLTILHLKEDLSARLPTNIKLEFIITEISENSFTAFADDPEFPNTMVYKLENETLIGYTLIDDQRREFRLHLVPHHA